jgi:ABC-type glycerol-3-phosphate transport system substrate-binding protein
VNAERAPVGKTRDGGWQIGVSAPSINRSKDVWDFLTSTEGTGLWLGQRGSRSYVATARMRGLRNR